MKKKILLSSAIALALGGAGQALAVDIDSDSGQIRYAAELTVDATNGSLVATADGTNDVLESTVTLGFSVSQGDSKYIRYDISGAEGAEFWSPVTTGRFGSSAAAADFTISSGGTAEDTYVIVEISADGANIPNDASITLNPQDVRVFDKSSTHIRYRLFDTPSDAVNGNNALKDVNAEWFGWAEGFTVSCTASSPKRINVVNPVQWVDETTTQETVFNVSVSATPDVYAVNGVLVDIVNDYFSNGSEILIEGSTAGFDAAAGDMQLAGEVAAATPDDGKADWATGAAAGAGVVELPLSSAAFQVTPSGGEMEPSSYSFSITDDGGATFDVGTVTESCGSLQYSGSTDRLDFALTPDGVFRQFVRVTNPSAVEGNVTFTVYNDGGDSVTFDMVDIDGVDSNELAARGSSPQININDVYAAAQTADANFEVGANPANKLRVEVRGEFGDDAFEHGEERSATDRRVDGIYIQGLTVARDNNAFFQTK